MKKLNETRNLNGGAKIYTCYWQDYSSSNYLKAYVHMVKHACEKGVFNLGVYLVKAGLALR